MTRARWFHLVTFLVAAVALVLQFVLICQGHKAVEVAHGDSGPDLSTRIVRFFSYLTIWSNMLVAWSAAALALGRDRNTPWGRALRLDTVALIAMVGIVHFLLLRPLLDLHGSDWVADKLLHMVVPAVAVVGWALFGPRGRAHIADLPRFLVIPVGWMVYTLVRGPFVDWYPYPFIDVDQHGYGVVALNSAGISVILLVLAFVAIKLDPKLPRE